MPGLLRGIAKTAVVAGTATATSNAVNRRQASRNAAAYQEAQQQYAQQPPPQATAATGGSDDTLARLERLGQLKAQGVLTEDEFASEKSKILNQ